MSQIATYASLQSITMQSTQTRVRERGFQINKVTLDFFASLQMPIINWPDKRWIGVECMRTWDDEMIVAWQLVKEKLKRFSDFQGAHKTSNLCKAGRMLQLLSDENSWFVCQSSKSVFCTFSDQAMATYWAYLNFNPPCLTHFCAVLPSLTQIKDITEEKTFGV